MKNAYPLSHAQRRIWYTQKKYPDSAMFHIGGTVEIDGRVDVRLLRQALCRVVSENDALRLRFAVRDGEPVQYLYEGEPEVELLDLSSEAEPEKAYETLCSTVKEEAFSTEGGKLYRLIVCRLRENKTAYFVKLHHLVADGWSMKLLTEQVTAAYEAQISGTVSDCPAKPSYLEYVAEEQTYLADASANGGAKKAEAYFRARLEKAAQADRDSFIVPHGTAAEGCGRGKRRIFRLDGGFCERLDAFLSRNRLTLNTFFTCVYLLYAAGFSSGPVTVGIPLLGRGGRRQRQMIGSFTNVLPFVFDLDKTSDMKDLLSAVSAEMYALLRHQRYPSDLLERLLPEGSRGRGSLFSVCINEYHTELPCRMCGCPVTNTEFYNGFQEYALQIIIRRWDGGMNLEFDYRLDTFSEEDIDRLYRTMMLLAGQLMIPNLKVHRTRLLPPDEWKEDIAGRNASRRAYPEKSFFRLFRDMAAAHPLWIAVSEGKSGLTYAELDTRIERCAARLLSFGVKAGEPLAVLARRNIRGVVLLLAAMRCGSIMVPLDPGAPPGRRLDLLKNCGAAFLVGEKADAPWDAPVHGGIYPCGKENPREADAGDGKQTKGVTFLDAASVCAGGRPSGEENRSVPFPAPDSAAYILYTSGSTGFPKGVRIRHSSLTNYLLGARDTYLSGEREVFALFTSFSYDFTLTSLLLPLICGGEIRISGETETNVFQNIVSEKRVTVLKLTPAHLPLLLEAGPASSAVHTVIFGGENLSAAACRRLADICGKRLRIFNEYGPTEATVGCAVYRYRGETAGIVPIGRPMPNVRMYLTDRLGRPVPRGVAGEIYIGGEGVAKGYHGGADGEEAEKRFSADPFEPGKTVYRTSDAGVRNADGDIICLGRLDRVVKIRGVRLSLAEIERCLTECASVKGAAVKAADIAGVRQLCAYVLGPPELDTEALRAELSGRLPSVMVPAFIMRMDSFPLSAGGKTDMERLPAPAAELCGRDGSARDMNLPETEELLMRERPKELQALLSTLSDVLNSTDIDIHTNFYAAGGDSIKAILVSSRLKDQGYRLEVRDILLNPSVMQMLRRITRDETVSADETVSGYIAGTPAVNRFFSSNLQEPEWYGQSVLLDVGQHAQLSVWERVFEELISHHDALRLNYDRKQGKLYYNPAHVRRKFCIAEVDMQQRFLSSDTASGISRFVQKTFDLESDLLIRACLLHLPDTDSLYVVAHHLVMDAVSFQIILQDMETLYRQISRGQPVRLPQKTASYQAYAEACGAKVFSEPVFVGGREPSLYGDAKRERIVLNEEQTRRFSEMGFRGAGWQEGRTEKLFFDGRGQNNPGKKMAEPRPDEWLLSVFAAGLAEVLELKEVPCIQERHGRDLFFDTDLTRTVGWFTQTEFFLLRPERNMPLSRRLLNLTEQLRGCGGGQKSDERPLLSVNYLGECPQDNEIFRLVEIVFDDDVGAENAFPCLCDVVAYILRGRLHAAVTLDSRISVRKRSALLDFVTAAMKNIPGLRQSCDSDTGCGGRGDSLSER